MLSGVLPSPTIARYVGRMFGMRTVAVLAGLVTILMTLDLIGEAGRILAVHGNTGDDVLRYTWLRLPQLISQFLPFSVLLAALLTLSELNAGSEVTIFKSAGISAHQILAPLFAVAAMVSVTSFAFNELVLVRTNSTLVVWKANDYADFDKVTKGGPGEVWARDGENLIHAERIEGAGSDRHLNNVSVYDRSTDGALTAIVRAGLAFPEAGGWRLEKVTRFEVESGRTEDMPTMRWPSAVGIEQFMGADPDPNAIAFWNLPRQIRAVAADGKPTASLEAALYHKVSGPLSALLMPLLGAVAGFGLARSGKLFVRAVIGMVLGFAFFVADNFMLAMGGFNAVPPVVAAWSPLLLFFLIGESVLLRTEE